MHVATDRVFRTLSAFNHYTRRWIPAPSGVISHLPLSRPSSDIPSAPTLSLVSWNIDAFSPRPIARSKLILNHILETAEPPDIIFFQEVTTGVRDSLINNTRIRGTFFITDAEDRTSFEDVPFSTMALLSSECFVPKADSQMAESGKEIEGQGKAQRKFTCGQPSRIALPSNYGRDALSIDIAPVTAPDAVFRLLNVHLDSLEDTLHYRTQQLEILANTLREPGYGGGVIAGDFNAISPEDDVFVDKNGLADAWIALHGTTNGATWSLGRELRDGLAPGRLDKVATVGVKAETIEILRPGSIEVPGPGKESVEIPWSDHCGLRCTVNTERP